MYRKSEKTKTGFKENYDCYQNGNKNDILIFDKPIRIKHFEKKEPSDMKKNQMIKTKLRMILVTKQNTKMIVELTFQQKKIKKQSVKRLSEVKLYR